MSTIDRTVSVGSLSSLMSDDSPKGKKKKANNNSVTVGFKYNWFDNTLSFIKDDRRLSLNYGGLTSAQAVFIRDMLSFETNPSVKLDKYAPLYEALTIFGLKFKFKLSRTKKNVIMLQKIPKGYRHTQQPDSTTNSDKTDINAKEDSVLDRLSQDYMVEIAKTILNFIEDPTRASLEFTKVKPLESMFMHAIMSATRPMFPEHDNLLKYLKERKSKMDFNVQIIVGKVNRRNRERTVLFNKVPKYRSNGQRSRDSSINSSNIAHKTFLPSSNSTHQQKNPTQTVNNSMEIDQNLPPKITAKANSTPDQQKSAQTQQNSTQAQQNSTQTQQNSTQAKRNPPQIVWNTTLDKRNATPVQTPMEVDSPISVVSSTITNCSSPTVSSSTVSSSIATNSPNSGSALDLSCETASAVEKPGSLGSVCGSQTSLNINSSTSINNAEWSARRGALDARKTKLLEAMSMPVQLDNAARMMQKMGWEGGPLGRRGVGITEPIIPALDLVSGAGFGHIKESKEPPKPEKPPKLPKPPKTPILPKPAKPPKTPTLPKTGADTNFRLKILHAILDMIRTDRHSVELLYDKKLAKKSIGFVRHLIMSISNRNPISLNDPYEAAAARIVFEALRGFPDLMIYSTVSECKRKISLRKGKIVIADNRTGIEPPKPQTGVITSEHLQRLAETINEHKDKPSKQKRYIGIRITLLIEILHLLKTGNRFKELLFEFQLSSQHMRYMVGAVERLNVGKKPFVCGRVLEQETVEEILYHIKDTVLVVNFDKRKMGVLIEKRLPQQMNDYNACVLNAFNSLNINVNNNYEFVPYTNLIVSYEGGRDFKIIDFTANSDYRHSATGSSVNNNSLNGEVNSKNINGPKVYSGLNKSSDPKGNNATYAIRNGDSIEEYHSSDDDVIIIETKRETIVISDDESTDVNGNSENSLNNDKLSYSVEEQEGLAIKITNIEGNVGVEDKSKTSDDKDISRSQNSTEESHNNLNIIESQKSVEFDTSKRLNSVEFDAFNAISLSAEKATCEGSINIDKNIETADIERLKDTTDIEKSKESIDVTLSGNSNVAISKTDIVTATCERSIDNEKNEESAAIERFKESEKSKDNIDEKLSRKSNVGVAISETDIDKVVPNIEPKKELSYSEEFDQDLYDLAMILNIDEDVFDYTIVKKEDLDKTERPMSKRSRSDSEQSSPDNFKKTKIFTFDKFKNLSIVPKDYPDVQLKSESAIEIQTILTDAIDNCKRLPLLKCHGIQDGGLVYSCHNEQSLFFIQDSLSVTSDYKIINDVIIKKRCHKMKIKFNSLLDDIRKLFNRIELYNAGLLTDNWCVKHTQKFDDYILISVEIDDYSYKYICDNNYCLYAGIDEVRFAVVWD